jgi:formamidopyrimidine-DNA glycosylase
MPELPELQAHAERLTDSFRAAVLEQFVPLSFTVLKTADPPAEVAQGQPLAGVGRRGKYLLLGFDACTFVVHLMQGGRLRVDDKQSARPRGGLGRWRFDDGRALLLTEAGTEKRAGVWVVRSDLENSEPLAGLGPDADQITIAQLAEALQATSMRLHGFLRDQRNLAGIGRRLANEVCHRARLSPFINTRKLDAEGVARLHDALAWCIDESLTFERARDDMSASKDRPGSVHHRTGEACPACGDTVRSVEYSSYTVAYCPTCQTDGKALADNTTSKFLK